jgi:enterochelin esterase-like enzyme
MARRRQRPWFEITRRVGNRWARGHLALAGAGVILATVAGHLPSWHHTSRALGAAHIGLTNVAGDAPLAGAQPARSGSTSPSRVVEEHLSSQAVGKTVPFLVYLPPGYDDESGRRYPVLYMLHGLGGSYRQWQEYGLLETADRLIGAGELAPFIIVMPQGDQAYWLNHSNGGPRWGQFVAGDLITAIDERYRTLSNREHRAVGGLSMGGHGALQLAINHPDVFGVVGAHSFALRRHEAAPPYFGDQAYFNAHDPVYLYRTQAAVARTFRLWLDVGADDPWQQADAAFHQQLADAAVRHAWRVYPGGHDGDYWSAHTADYLRFYGSALAGDQAG